VLAREANVVIEDRRFAAELRGKLRADMERGARVVGRRAGSGAALEAQFPTGSPTDWRIHHGMFGSAGGLTTQLRRE